MMGFMGPPDRLEINAIRSAEKGDPLVDEYIMHKEIRHTVQTDAEANPKISVEMPTQPNQQTHNPGQSEDQEEEIVVL
jgi:hypothetical protein